MLLTIQWHFSKGLKTLNSSISVKEKYILTARVELMKLENNYSVLDIPEYFKWTMENIIQLLESHS